MVEQENDSEEYVASILPYVSEWDYGRFRYYVMSEDVEDLKKLKKFKPVKHYNPEDRILGSYNYIDVVKDITVEEDNRTLLGMRIRYKGRNEGY